MAVTVLVIMEALHHHMTIHSDERDAARFLAGYVAANWRAVMKGALYPASDNERVARFFTASSRNYFIAEVDVDPTGTPVALTEGARSRH